MGFDGASFETLCGIYFDKLLPTQVRPEDYLDTWVVPDHGGSWPKMELLKMGGSQNYGPFLGTLNIRYNRDPERDHNFDNHPNVGLESLRR